MINKDKKIDTKLSKLMEDGRILLADGKITAAHHVFAHIAKFNPAYPHIGHALAVSLPNSFIVKIVGQFDKINTEFAKRKIFELLKNCKTIKLLILDFEVVKSLPHFVINLLKTLKNTEGISLMLINLQLKPLQILKNLNFDDIIWNDRFCPICGEKKKCAAKFSKRKKHEIILPNSSDL